MLIRLKEEKAAHADSSSCLCYIDSNGHYHCAEEFIDRTLYSVLSNPDRLLESLRDHGQLEVPSLEEIFRGWDDSIILDSFWVAAEALTISPPRQEPIRPFEARHGTYCGRHLGPQALQSKNSYLENLGHEAVSREFDLRQKFNVASVCQ
ncbi:hypothetical protein M011DRAFT_465460 [Sporormia fimetaria CBS 119925]|uniref:Uncharacterized protein n=1 Tax=Sporormia fimetaria CBS 119925 TaxID=1340428 RepID=A0A6A6VKR3_9PLEO|nr:hypothetical protein M011DRAFT_465460 [Sporormia fimetaria CBS 119925]